MSVEIPSKLEVLITKDDCVVIGTSYDYYSQLQMLVLYNAVMVPREDVDPEFDLNISPHKVFEAYLHRQENCRPNIRVPYLNTRIHLAKFYPPEDIWEYLNIERPAE